MADRISRGKETEGVHWIQMVGWGVFISLVMFGFGMMVGLRLGEQRAADKFARSATQPLPPELVIRSPAVREHGAGNPEEEIWDILNNEGDVIEFEGSADPQDIREHTRSDPQPTHRNDSNLSTAGPAEVSYSIQVASFQDEQKAYAYREELARKGYTPARVVRVEIEDRGTWYRIRVGRFAEKIKAEKVAMRIRASEHQKPQVMMEKE